MLQVAVGVSQEFRQDVNREIKRNVRDPRLPRERLQELGWIARLSQQHPHGRHRRSARTEVQTKLSVAPSRYAPCALSGGLGFPHTLFLQTLVPFNLLPMTPNDCYPCPRPKHAEAGCRRHKKLGVDADSKLTPFGPLNVKCRFLMLRTQLDASVPFVCSHQSPRSKSQRVGQVRHRPNAERRPQPHQSITSPTLLPLSTERTRRIKSLFASCD